MPSKQYTEQQLDSVAGRGGIDHTGESFEQSPCWKLCKIKIKISKDAVRRFWFENHRDQTTP